MKLSQQGFIVLGIVIFAIFVFIMYNEPSTQNVTGLVDCALDKTQCQEGQGALVTNILVFLVVIAGFLILRREGFI